jgi:hypothetical protein
MNKTGAGRRHKGIRHNLHFLSRGRNEKRLKGKKLKESGIIIYSKPERGMKERDINKRSIIICSC